ncbi:uncharacterized protein LOC130696603 [Daphnia carinata]|uniref:uncharacterized protein LOC130696603 n=1 Tax=Daphnia carinata TaxID=120202 RepID=UPI00257CAFFA|nr:uncharacterized protein LOC130696603 [Daphnia carinata]
MRNTFQLCVVFLCLVIVNSSHAGSRSFVNRQYAQVRSDWVPTERGGRASVVFPLSSNTNAGQLNYQIQDAAKHRAEKDAVRTSTTSRSVYFQDYPELKTPQPVNEFKSVSGFRPSQAYPITSSASEPVVEKREFPAVQSNAPYTSNINENIELAPKTGKYIITGGVVPSLQTVEVVTTSPSLTDYSDLVDAMEHLVERLNELETKLENQEAKETLDENSRSILAMNSALTSTKEKLEAEVTSLSARTLYLEQRLSDLEEVTREWINPNNLGYYDNTKTTEKRGAARRCPTQFFSLDVEDPAAPCYSISTEPNVRKNWQDAAGSCKEINAKLAEPKSTDELRKLTDYLRYNRTDQIGGGYWTGGLNPGLMWLWPSLGSSLTNIDPTLWLTTSDAIDTNNGKCLRLSYDRTSQRYALQGSDCQRYLYFVCEYDKNGTAPTIERLEKSMINGKEYEDTTASSVPRFTSTTAIVPGDASISVTQPTTTTQPPPRSYPVPHYKRISWPASITTTRATTTTQAPPTPNYVGVIGFKGIPPKLRNEIPLNLAVLEESNS